MSQGLTIFIGIFLILLLAAVLVLLIYWRGLSSAVFYYCFKRTLPDRWNRGKCSDTTNKGLYRMWETGLDWELANKTRKQELQTVNGKEQLAAQYYDFGKDTAVIIVPGMFETSSYSCYFAGIWQKAGFNILLVDNRATGNSGGEYNTIGLLESEDILQWAEVLNERHGIRRVVIHGISMGASVGLLALSLPSCPAYIAGIVCDEAYFRFDVFFKNHMIKKRYNPRVLRTVLNRLRRVTGADPDMVSPASFIGKINTPVLFLAGRKDELTDADQTGEMYAACGSSCGNSRKDLVWFENGEHGFIRLCDPEKYDAAIEQFIKERLLL